MIDSNALPKVYRSSPARRILSVLLIGIALFLPAVMLTTAPRADMTIYAIGLLLGAVGIGLILLVLTAKVTLCADRITRSNIFVAKAILRPEIQGYCSWQLRGATMIDLFPSDDRIQKMTVRKDDNDTIFSAWLEGLRNLDEEDRSTDSATGATHYLGGLQ